MKTSPDSVQKSFRRTGIKVPALLLLFFVFLFSCGDGGTEKAGKEKLKEVKEKTTQDLSKIKIDMEQRIEYLDTEIEKATGELKEKLQAARSELLAQKELLEKELENVKNASLETWDSVVTKVSESVKNTKSKSNQISKDVRGWLDSE